MTQVSDVPGILYGNFFAPGKEQVLLTRNHRIEVL